MSNPKHEIADSTESSDSSGSTSGSRGRNDSLLLRNGRYKRVPTSDEQLQMNEDRRGHRTEMNDEGKERIEDSQDLERINRYW